MLVHIIRVYAFNADTGDIVRVYATESIVIYRPAIAEGVVYVGSEDYNLYALVGLLVESSGVTQTGYYVNSDPTVVDGRRFWFRGQQGLCSKSGYWRIYLELCYRG